MILFGLVSFGISFLVKDPLEQIVLSIVAIGVLILIIDSFIIQNKNSYPLSVKMTGHLQFKTFLSSHAEAIVTYQPAFITYSVEIFETSDKAPLLVHKQEFKSKNESSFFKGLISLNTKNPSYVNVLNTFDPKLKKYLVGFHKDLNSR